MTSQTLLAAQPVVQTVDPLQARLRWSIAAMLVAITLAATARLWFVSGLLQRISVAGPSMAPALIGRHYKVACADCRFPFACDAEHLPANRLAACPNCGFTANKLSDAPLLPADRVLIDGWPPLWRRPERGAVWAFAASKTAGDFAVKRVAAIGGEQLAIRDGDLHIGNSIVRKSLAELRAMQILVHDNAYAPHQTKNLPQRWRAAEELSGWIKTPSGFRIKPQEAVTDAVDWLEYTHWPSTANSRLRGVPSPITDNDAFNQGETRRTLNVVPDVMLSCRVRVAGAGRLLLAAVDGEQRFELEIEPRKRLVLRRQDAVLLDEPCELSLGRGAHKLEFGLCDQQVLLAIGGRTVVRYAYERPEGAQPEVLHPLSIGAAGLGLVVDELRVWRDIYFLDPHSLPRPWQMDGQLAEHEIAVLGDNQPVSIDSRQFDSPGVALRQLLGRVYRPFWVGQ